MTTPTAILDLLREANRVPDPMVVHDGEAAEALYTAITRRTGTSPAPPSGAVRPLGRPWYRRPATVFATAMVATVILLIPVMLFRWWGSSEPASPTEPTTTTVPPNTTTTVSTSAWERLDVGAAFDNAGEARNGGVIDFRDGILAWTRRGVVALSDDALTWTQVVGDLEAIRLSGATGARVTVADYLRAVAVGPMGVAAVDGIGVLFSEAGTTWDRVSTGWVGSDVVVFDGAFVAVGYVGPAANGVVYRSTDGRTWTEVHHVEGTNGQNNQCAYVQVVVADSYLIATAYCPTPQLWRSSDGVTWIDVTPSEAAAYTMPPDLPGVGIPDCSFDAGYYGNPSVVAEADRVVVAGDCPSSGTVVWVSDDGVKWEMIESPLDVDSNASWVGLAAAGPGFVGVVARHEGDPTLPVATSPDGVNWTVVETLMPALPTGMELYDWACGGHEGSGWICGDPADAVFEDPQWAPFVVSVQVAGDTMFLLAQYFLARIDGPMFCTQAIWVSHDNAASWQVVPIDLDRFMPADLAFYGTDHGDQVVTVVAHGDQYVFLGTGAWVWTPPED